MKTLSIPVPQTRAMSRAVIRAALFAFATGAALTAGESRPPAQVRVSTPRPPNIVLLIADDVRWDSLGVAGNRWGGVV